MATSTCECESEFALLLGARDECTFAGARVGMADNAPFRMGRAINGFMLCNVIGFVVIVIVLSRVAFRILMMAWIWRWSNDTFRGYE